MSTELLAFLLIIIVVGWVAKAYDHDDENQSFDDEDEKN
jgi:hypothetical protein